MSNLSWFLYAAGVIPNLGDILGVLGWGLLTCWVLFHIFSVEDEHPFGHILLRHNFFLKPTILAAILILLSTLMPTKETIYLIAGSEAGEVVVTSEVGQEILEDIQTIIKQQIRVTKD